MKKITIDFSGNIVIHPENIHFCKLDKDGYEIIISGTRWLKLSKDAQSEYVIESLSHALDGSDEINSLEIEAGSEIS